jgi:hypothetical protein
MRLFIYIVLIGGLGVGAAAAPAGESPAACAQAQACGDSGTCSHCGRHCDCQKYCRIVCETKDVKKTVWVVKCEEICTMMPNCGCHECCCDEGGAANAAGEKCCCKKCDPCAGEAKKSYVTPKCGKVHEVKKLEKKEVICKVPSYKCVVVYCCPQCGEEQNVEKASPAPAAPPASTPIPPPPKPSKTAMSD